MDTYTPPADVARNARLALEVRASKPESEQGMTAVGLARANQLANREAVSLDTIRRMASYFARHEVDKDGSTWDEQGKGWQAWHGWGGDEGRAWANRIIKEHDAMSDETKSIDGFTPRQRMISAALIEVVHEEGKFDWGLGANGAHYVEQDNPFLAQNIRCEECVFYDDNFGCAIVEGVINPNAICKFWIIPEDEITTGIMPIDEGEDMADTIETAAGDTPIYLGASFMEAMGLIKSMTREQARAIVMEWAKEHPDEASIVYESMENQLMAGKVDLSTAERDALPDEDFVIPSSRNFPITSPQAVSDAVSSWGRYRGDVSFETFKRNLIRIAMRKGQDYVDALPQEWQDEMQKRIVAEAKRYLALLTRGV